MLKLYKVIKTIEYVLAAPENKYKENDLSIDTDGMTVSIEYTPINTKEELPKGWTLNDYPYGNPYGHDPDKTIEKYFE
jgi:hypothetical protein